MGGNKRSKSSSYRNKNPNGKNQWMEYPDAGEVGIPEHHDTGHVHATHP